MTPARIAQLRRRADRLKAALEAQLTENARDYRSGTLTSEQALRLHRLHNLEIEAIGRLRRYWTDDPDDAVFQRAP